MYKKKEVLIWDLKEGNGLSFRYTPPMIINQPGHIIVSDFISYEQISKMLIDKSAQLKEEKLQSDNQKKLKIMQKRILSGLC